MKGPIVLLLLAAAAMGTGIPRDLADDAEKFLLPGDISPVNYNLTLFTNIEKFQTGQESTFVFSGIVEITVDVLYDNVTDVVLHTYDDVGVVSATITLVQSGVPLRTVTIGSYDAETNKQVFFVSPPLRRGEQYLITINYTGRNTNALTGFYRSSYMVGLKRRWLLVTDFESFGARRAFPSFDEPEYKATFQLTVSYNQTLAEDGYSANFNTDVESEVVRNGRHITTFQKTALPLSTYLVAFIVSDFVSSPEPTYFNSSYNGENGTKPFRTIGQSKFFKPRQDLVSQVAGPAALNFMTQKTKVGFGLRKVEQAGIPDFAAGAMENWGLVTYRESLVFWNEQSGSTGQKQSVVTVTAHELGHQWFGDLVTLHWWSDLWLNEGFATFFEFHAPDKIREPTLDTSSWELIGQFVEDVMLGTAFPTDSFSDSRPLTFDAFDRDSVDDFFDGISYEKGGSVLRMWMHVLGEDLFYAGLNRYLTSQEEGVGTPEILLASWDGAIDALPAAQKPRLPATVAELFEGWHLQAGYPVISVTRQGTNLTITQERYLWDTAPDSNRWNVPISYSTDLENRFNDTTPVVFLLESQNSASFQIADASAEWFVLNNQATGYYRIDYDDDNWETLIEILRNPATAGQIHEYNRAQILDDASELARSVNKNYQSYDTVLRLLASLRHERSLVVWRAAIRAMRYLLAHVETHAETSSLLKTYLRWVVEPAFTDLSLYVREEDSHTQKLLRADVASMACFLDHPDCQQQASRSFTEGSAHPDVRLVVMCETVKQGGPAMWVNILEEGLQAEWPVRRDLLSALTCTNDHSLIDRLHELILNDDRLSEVDKWDIMAAAAQGDASHAEWALTLLTRQRVSKNHEVKMLLKDIGLRLSGDEKALVMEPIHKATARMISMNGVWQQKKQPEVLQWLKTHLPR